MKRSEKHSDQQASNTDGSTIGRRQIMSAAATAAAASSGAAFIIADSEVAKADVDGSLSASLDSASVSTDDGSVAGINLDDPGDGIDVQWEGFDTAPSFTIEFGVSITGNADGTSTSTEYLMSGSVSTSSTSGDKNVSWSSLWGQSTVDITNHSNIALSDFTAGTDGGTKTNNVQITLRLSEADLSSDVTKTANADISITNIARNADVGGNVTTNITK